MPDRPHSEEASADRRTSLAGERTLLAWWRTGFTAIAVALGVGRVLPELAPHSTRWPFTVLGVAFAMYGVALIGYGSRRMRVLDRELGTTSTVGLGERALWVIAGAGTLLGLAAAVLIIAQ